MKMIDLGVLASFQMLSYVDDALQFDFHQKVCVVCWRMRVIQTTFFLYRNKGDNSNSKINGDGFQQQSNESHMRAIF